MTPSTRNVMSVVASSLLASAVGGGVSMYVAFRVLEERLGAMDTKVRDQAAEIAGIRLTFEAHRAATEARNETLRNDLARIAADTAYVRGVIESSRRVTEK